MGSAPGWGKEEPHMALSCLPREGENSNFRWAGGEMTQNSFCIGTGPWDTTPTSALPVFPSASSLNFTHWCKMGSVHLSITPHVWPQYISTPNYCAVHHTDSAQEAECHDFTHKGPRCCREVESTPQQTSYRKAIMFYQSLFAI